MRGFLILAALLLAGAGVGIGLASGGPDGIGLIVGAALLIAFVLLERSRYKRLVKSPPSSRFQRTTERFVDTESGKEVTVWINPETGERVYVHD